VSTISKPRPEGFHLSLKNPVPLWGTEKDFLLRNSSWFTITYWDLVEKFPGLVPIREASLDVNPSGQFLSPVHLETGE
jgi:hypothetical protein